MHWANNLLDYQCMKIQNSCMLLEASKWYILVGILNLCGLCQLAQYWKESRFYDITWFVAYADSQTLDLLPTHSSLPHQSRFIVDNKVGQIVQNFIFAMIEFDIRIMPLKMQKSASQMSTASFNHSTILCLPFWGDRKKGFWPCKKRLCNLRHHS